MSKKNVFSPSFRVTFLSLTLAVAMILGYVESIIPTSIVFPGFKIGLPNVAVLLVLRRLGAKYAISLNLCRIFLSSLLFGNAFSLLLSVCGGVAAIAVEWILHRLGVFSVMGESAAGGALHNFAQCVAASFLFSTPSLMRLSPWLLILGGLTGVLCGFSTAGVEKILGSKPLK